MSKTIEELLNAPSVSHNAMISCVDYMNNVSELRDDIAERFHYPSLWAAIDRLMMFEEKHIRAEIAMLRAGYTYDDAFTLHEYYAKNADTPA